MNKGPNFPEGMLINSNNWKREMEIGLTQAQISMISTHSKVTTEEFAEYERKVLQEVDNKIISLKDRMKVHKTNLR